ncbi:MAG: hypothetical protein GY866_11090 [Proteobacteria bacterium]|nr:hypothetical protein [Pseudomonadota bacterium]
MSFIPELKDRIQNLIGLNPQLEEDYSFLQPGGNDHLVQFFYKNLADEYLELEEWDRYNLMLIDLSAALDIDFVLDEDARFATLVRKNGKGVKIVQAVMDLRDDYLAAVYYFGDSKTCFQLNQKLNRTTLFHPCYLNSAVFVRLAQSLEKIRSVEYDFEQLPSMFLEPVIMRGILKGELVHDMFFDYMEKYRYFFNIDSIAGYLKEGSQGTVVVRYDGTIKVDVCRLSSFLHITGSLFDMLREKYRTLMERDIVFWDENPRNSLLKLNGSPIKIMLHNRVDTIEGLVKFLTQGNRSVPIIGISERISRKLWSVKVTETTSAEQVELEISDSLVRIFVGNRNAIPILDKIERFFRQHINAEFDNHL